MKRNGWLRRDFNLGALGAALLGALGTSNASAQQSVITSTGQGMEGEITSTGPHRRRGQPPNNVPPPGSAPAPGTVASATILVLGDSLSAEYGIPRGKGWVALLADKLQAERPDVRVVNASISGDTTSGGASRLPALLEREKPALVIIELGANDALRGLSLKASAENLERMIKMAQGVHAQVLLIGMQIPPNYGKQYTEAFQEMFVNAAKQNKTRLVPFLLEGIATDRALFQADGIHPNETAQPRMMETVLSELEPMLKASPRPNRP